MWRLYTFPKRTWRPLHSSAQCGELGELLHHAEQRNGDISSLLDESGIHVTSERFCQALGGVEDAEVALGFFCWAGKQSGFMHTPETCSRVLRMVVDSRGRDGYRYFKEQLASRMDQHPECMLLENTILSHMWEDDPPTAVKYSETLTRKDISTYRIVISGLFRARLADMAFTVLKKMPAWPPSTCLEIIQDVCESGKCRDAHNMFIFLQQQGLDVHEHEIPFSLVRGLFKAYEFEEGLGHFTWLIDNGYRVDRKSYSYAVDMLCKANRLDSAVKMYEKMKAAHTLDIVACNTILGGLVAADRLSEALDMLEHAVRIEGLSPSCITYCVFIEGLVKRGRLDDAYAVYQEAVDNGQVSRIFAAYKMLFHGLFRERRDKEVVELFGRYVDVGGVPTVQMCSDTIASLCRVGKLDEALELYESAPLKGFKVPSGHLLFNEFWQAKRTLECSRVLKHLLERGQLRQSHHINSTMDALCKEGMINEAEAWFREVKRYRVVDAVTYNILMHGLFKLERVEDGIALYREMKADGFVPVMSTYNTLIRGLCIGNRMEEALNVFNNLADSGAEVNAITYNTVVDGLCKADRIPEALELLEKMVARGGELTAHPYNSIMDAYFKSGKFEAATKMLERMEEDGMKPQDVTYSILIDGLCKANRLSEAKNVFSSYLDKNRIPSDTMISCLIDGLCKNGQVDEGHSLFELITSHGAMLNDVGCNIVINGLCKTNRLAEAKAIFNRVVKGQLRPNVVTYTTMINGYCRAKRVNEARALLKQLIARGGKPNTVLYTTLIAGLCTVGRLDEARKVLDVEMKAAGCAPNTFTCNILVNGFGVAGRMKEAQELFQRFVELGVQPNKLTFTAMTKNMAKSEGWDSYSWSEWMTQA